MIKEIAAQVTVNYKDEHTKARMVAEVTDAFIEKGLKEVYTKPLCDDISCAVLDFVLAGEMTESLIHVEVIIYGELIHKHSWYKERQELLHEKLSKWFSGLPGITLVIKTSLHPTDPLSQVIPEKCG